MAVLKTYPLDLSAIAISNKITGEVKQIVRDADRVFIPTAGPFYTKSLKVWAGTKLLQPITDYVALEMNREGTLASGKEVCNVLFIKNAGTSFKLDYQVIGGNFSDTSNELIDLINATPIDKLKILTWGSILGKPTTFPPTAHVHYPYEWRGYTQVIHLLEQLRQLIVAGDQASLASIYDYIENNIKDIASEYIDKNGLFFIDKTPTANGNVLLAGKGTVTEPLKIDLDELLNELDVRYFQNSINPLSRVGAISDSFLPISAGFFNCLVPLNEKVSLSCVGNVERNGDLLMLTPATNGEITRYVYSYVRDWSSDPNIQRFRPTNQQYRPPGLASNEEIMDLFGYHEQSMIGSIFTVNPDGSATFKENCAIWLNGTLAAENHVLERLGNALISVVSNKAVNWLYGCSPKVVKMRRGEKYLIYYSNASGIHVFRWDVSTKKFVQTKNWKGILQTNTIDPTNDLKTDTVIDTTETVIRTGQDICRPFAWQPDDRESEDEFLIFDHNVKSDKITSIRAGWPGLNRMRMNCRVVGDVIKVMTTISYQYWIYDPAYRGGSVEVLGFSLEIYPLESVPTYKWIRHTRENGAFGTGRASSGMTHLDRGYVDFYETSAWSLLPMDLISRWTWWDNLQPATYMQLNDGRVLVWRHPAPSGYPIGMTVPTHVFPEDYDIERMFVLYFNMKYWGHPQLGRGSSRGIGEDVINFPSPTANRVNSVGVVLGDGTVVMQERFVNPRTASWSNVKMTAYRPSTKVIDYPTATDGVLKGFDTTDDRIKLVGDYNGEYDLIPWVSARKADGTVKVGGSVVWRPTGKWADQTFPASIRIDWDNAQLIREELYTFTELGYNAIEDYIATKVALPGATTLHYTWTIVISPVDVNTGLLHAYAGRDNRTANEYVIPVKLQWDNTRSLAGITIAPGEIHGNSYNLVPSAVFDPRYSWTHTQWVIDYSKDMSKAFWAGKMPLASSHVGDTMPRAAVYTYQEAKSGPTSTWIYLAGEGNQSTTSGYKSFVATKLGVGMFTDTVGYGVFRALKLFKGLNYDSGTIYSAEKPFIYVTPRPPSDFSLNITDTIDIQLGGVYGQITPQTYRLSDPTVSDIVDPRNKTIYIYVVLELGKPRINFREVPMAESIYAAYIGKCLTDEYGVMELDIKPVTRIGNYRASATPQGSAFSVSSGTPDTERLLNWDANIASSNVEEDGTLPEEGGESNPGDYEYVIGVGQSFNVSMIGGGGAGGNAAWQNQGQNRDGGTGGSTQFFVEGKLLFSMNGGRGGTGGWYDNGSAWGNGKGGDGGVMVFSDNVEHGLIIDRIVMRSGNPGLVIDGAAPVFPVGPNGAGAGGQGVDGVRTASEGRSGGGGSGGYISFRVRNASNSNVTLKFKVGEGGSVAPDGSRKGSPGHAGGFFVVKN